MKTKALALVLALCMVLAMLPMTVHAAPANRAQAQLSSLEVLEPAALPDPPVETNGKYDVSLSVTSGKSHGTAKLYSTSANRGQDVLMLIDPDPGYYAEIGYSYSYYYEKATMEYWGKNEYVLHMGDGDVEIEVQFKKITEGSNHSVTVLCSEGGSVKLSQSTAKPGESIILEVTENFGYRLTDVVGDVNPDQEVPIFDVSDSEDELILEFFMPDGDVTLNFTFTRNGPYYPDGHLNGELFNTVGTYSDETGTVTMSPFPAYAGETMTVTVEPNVGYRVERFYYGHGDYTQINDCQWTFVMPDHNVSFHVDLVAVINPLSVTVETGLGGTASLSHTTAQEGDTVTLTCIPEEGYRVAQITGVSGLTDNGDGTYTFVMPAKAVDIKVLFLRHENPFLDVNETHFFYDPVLWAVEEGITSGMTPETFGPFAVCNRAQVVTFLWRAAGSPEPTTTENPFADVPADSFYYKPVLWAVENGITNGISSTEFGPGLACNRAQVVTFLHRSKGTPEPETSENPFEDVKEGDFFHKAVLWALENGVTTGADATHFNPNGQCQRAQVVTFLYRADGIPMTYAVDAQFDAEMGTVTLSHTKAQAGETITATVVPAEGYVLEAVKCVSGSEVTQVSDTEFTFVMPDFAELFQVYFTEIPEEPEPTNPTEPSEPDPTEPTDPIEPDPTEPVQTFELDLRDNGSGRVAYVDGKTTAAPGESIFFYALPNEGYYLDHVGVFNPDGAIDVSTIQIHEHGDGLYELIMIPRDLIMTCYFYPIA